MTTLFFPSVLLDGDVCTGPEVLLRPAPLLVAPVLAESPVVA